MKMTLLVENHTIIDRYWLGEPGISYFIEDGNEKILFDLGYSDTFIRNARNMNIDLNKVTKIVLSHGHDDHTGGFKYLKKEYNLAKADFICHPEIFNPKISENKSIGFDQFPEDVQSECNNIIISREPVQISEHNLFLGEIPSIFDFEKRIPLGEKKSENGFSEDYLLEDSALVYQGEEGLFIITGCSHSGICNIIEHAKRICKQDKVLGVIGGFHLFDVDVRVDKTIEYFMENQIKDLYPCHCVSFQVKAKINESIPIHEVGVGLTIEVF